MTKRRRHNEAASTTVSLSSDSGAGPSCVPSPIRRSMHILDLPMEMLVQVVSLCGPRHLCESVRLVSRRFRRAAGLALEAEVSQLERRIKAAMAASDAAVHASPTHYSLETNTRVFGSLEIVLAQYRLLRAVTWRYRGCFYAGRLLQDVHCLLRNAVEVPRAVAFRFQPQSAPSAVPDRVAFEARVERFMTHFERHTERLFNSGPAVSGAKLVDILDCLEGGPDYYNMEKDDGRCRLRALYRLPRCWFCCLRVGSPPPPDVESASHDALARRELEEWAAWRDAARFLFLRVRRLVAACNRHQLQARHVEREQLLQMPRSPLPPPRPDAYSGVGVHPPFLFFYGSMNHSAYVARFDDSGGSSGSSSGSGGSEGGQVAGGSGGSDAAGPSAGAAPPPPPPQKPRPAPSDLLVSVELDCPLWQAPLRAHRDQGAFCLPRPGVAEPFTLALEFRCARAGADRLPSTCRFLISDCSAATGNCEPAFDVALSD